MPGDHRRILGMRVDVTSYADAVARVLAWARAGESRSVCVANAHTVMETYDSVAMGNCVNGADLVTPDGMSLVWILRYLGVRDQERVYGPDLTLAVCEAASAAGMPVGFYGGRPEVNARLAQAMRERFPGLQIALSMAPPFRALTPAEDEQIVARINASGARILFVGLGCPKQEQWMADHRGRVHAVMLGVGAAFDFHAGLVRQAPRWMQGLALEWLFRLLMEPRRLWRRYLKHNPRFAVLSLMQVLGLARF